VIPIDSTVSAASKGPPTEKATLARPWFKTGASSNPVRLKEIFGSV